MGSRVRCHVPVGLRVLTDTGPLRARVSVGRLPVVT